MVEGLRFAVVGPGAVGGYFGGRLAATGHDVTFIARDRTRDALQNRGLRIDSPKGDITLATVQATSDPKAIGRVNVVFVAVKAWQVAEVAPTLVPLVGPDTLVVPLQNGVEARGHLAAAVGEAAVCGGLCRILAERVAPGHIRHHGAEPLVTFGEWDGTKSPRIEALAAILRDAGIAVNVPDDIQVAVWEKFLFIAAVSGVGAVSRMPLGVLRAQAEPRALLEQTMLEIVAVGRAHGVRILDGVVQKTMAFVDQLPADSTASMQRDLMAGRPSELHDQNGAVVRLGQQVDVLTPLNTFLYHVLLPMERQARGIG